MDVIYVIFGFYLSKLHVRAFFNGVTIAEQMKRDQAYRDKILYEKGDMPIQELCNHLLQLGLDATIDQSIKWEATRPEEMNRYIRIRNRQIDLVELTRSGSFGSYYWNCNYIVQGNVEGLERQLKARAKAHPITKGNHITRMTVSTITPSSLMELAHAD
jgi:hypothetical protein